jgi:hypothetical protein
MRPLTSTDPSTGRFDRRVPAEACWRAPFALRRPPSLEAFPLGGRMVRPMAESRMTAPPVSSTVPLPLGA